MISKPIAFLSVIATLSTIPVTMAYSQGGYYGDPGYRRGYRPRCLSSDGINDSLARRGLYPLANVGGDPGGRYIYMRVAQGGRQFVVTVDGCTAQILR